MSLSLRLARTIATSLNQTAAREWTTASGLPPAAAAPGERFLVNISAGIGDTLMALPMIRVLRQSLPDCRIVLLASAPGADLLQTEPGIDGVIAWPATPTAALTAKLAWRIRGAQFDAALGTIPSNLVSTSVVLWLSGVSLRIKHQVQDPQRDKDWQFLFTDLIEGRPTEHKVTENLALLGPAGVRHRPYSSAELAQLMQLTVGAAERRDIHDRFPAEPGRPVRIGMHPGCTPGWEFKRWDPRKFATLADRLAGEHNASIMWFGGADEAPLVRSIMRDMRTPSVSVAGRLRVRESAVLMSSCRVFVSNDSGPMHMATAAGVPTVALFSTANPRTNPTRTGPFGDSHVVIGRPDLQDVTADDVAAAVARLL